MTPLVNLFLRVVGVEIGSISIPTLTLSGITLPGASISSVALRLKSRKLHVVIDSADFSLPSSKSKSDDKKKTPNSGDKAPKAFSAIYKPLSLLSRLITGAFSGTVRLAPDLYVDVKLEVKGNHRLVPRNEVAAEAKVRLRVSSGGGRWWRGDGDVKVTMTRDGVTKVDFNGQGEGDVDLDAFKAFLRKTKAEKGGGQKKPRKKPSAEKPGAAEPEMNIDLKLGLAFVKGEEALALSAEVNHTSTSTEGSLKVAFKGDSMVDVEGLRVEDQCVVEKAEVAVREEACVWFFGGVHDDGEVDGALAAQTPAAATLSESGEIAQGMKD